jgi:hypothetical protein
MGGCGQGVDWGCGCRGDSRSISTCASGSHDGGSLSVAAAGRLRTAAAHRCLRVSAAAAASSSHGGLLRRTAGRGLCQSGRGGTLSVLPSGTHLLWSSRARERRIWRPQRLSRVSSRLAVTHGRSSKNLLTCSILVGQFQAT